MSGDSQVQQSQYSLGNIFLSQNIYHLWYIIICITGIRILLGKAQPYVKSEQGSLPLMPFYLFGCWSNYRLERRRTRSENGHIPRCSRHLFAWNRVQEKNENQEIKKKLAVNAPQRHIANPLAGNGACLGEGWDGGGAEWLDFLMEQGGFSWLLMARAIFPVAALCLQQWFQV